MRKKKKGNSGAATAYLTRKQAMKKLQVNLSVFRKLCILKGVYPREPTKAPRGKDKTYYYAKDIKFLLHDPILAKFREFRAWKKKVKKARGRGEKDAVHRLNAAKPRYALDHIVKERFPTFQAALAGLDDALSSVALFSTFPQTFRVKKARVETCERLYWEWQEAVIRLGALSSVFVSIKGYYFRAIIEGVTITWLYPHNFAHTMPHNVDYRVMLSFLEFYETLLGFINFKLYTTLGEHYPPVRATSNSATPKLLQGGQKTAEPLSQELSEKLESLQEDEDEVEEDEKTVIEKKDLLFSKFTFFLSREVPFAPIKFMIRALGGTVYHGMDESGVTEKDTRITHHVIDRPLKKKMKGREYIQPQWIFDCINSEILLPVHEYAPGKKLPPHLSPFVNNEKEGYVPERQKELDSYRADAPEKDEKHETEFEEVVDQEKAFADEMRKERGEENEEEEEKEEEAESDERDDEDDSESESEDEEEKMKKIMISSRKKQRLYTRIKHSEKAKRDNAKKLTKKRKAASEPKKSKKQRK